MVMSIVLAIRFHILSLFFTTAHISIYPLSISASITPLRLLSVFFHYAYYVSYLTLDYYSLPAFYLICFHLNLVDLCQLLVFFFTTMS